MKNILLSLGILFVCMVSLFATNVAYDSTNNKVYGKELIISPDLVHIPS